MPLSLTSLAFDQGAHPASQARQDFTKQKLKVFNSNKSMDKNAKLCKITKYGQDNRQET